TVVDREAYTEQDTYSDWTDWILLEKDLPEPPNVPENEEFVEFRATEPEHEGSVTTHYAYTDGVVCPPTEPTEPPTDEPTTTPTIDLPRIPIVNIPIVRSPQTWNLDDPTTAYIGTPKSLERPAKA